MIEAMEKNLRDHVEGDDHKFELPAGFRFHPTDEELITHYLSQKVLDGSFSANAIGEADLNKCEPWDLPWMAKMGENEWYFFCVRDRKYPTGLRTNRATGAGYWKATGKDKEIYREKILIGMKKTLVFYKGRAPKGEKTNWVMHEYRLEDKHSMNNLHKRAMNEWAICRVFEKGSCGQKMQVIGMERHNSFGKELPPLMEDSSPQNMSETKASIMESSHVTCYSDPNLRDDNNNIVDSKLTSSYSSNISPASWSTFGKAAPHADNSLSSDCLMVQEQSMLRMLIENHGSSTNHIYQKAQECDFDADISSAMYNNEMFQRSFGNVDNGCLWNF